MLVIDDLSTVSLRQETVLTIGAFDGVHRGHQALVGRVVSRARASNRLAGLITFHPHPAVVLAPGRAPRYLTTPGEKVALLEGLGLDLVALMRFNQELATMSARDFIERVATRLRLRELWVGSDFAMGHNREGDVSRLRLLGQEFGYTVHVVQPVLDEGGPISSSRIRALLREGDIVQATHLLGRYPRLSGEVVAGAARGRRLGIPTANLEVRPERAIPADGVYAVYAVLGTQRYPGVANVGVRPSFDNGERTVETHILDFDREIYGCDLVVEFVARLRSERRFEDIQDLMAQIGEDIEMAREMLDDPPGGSGNPQGASQDCPYRYREVEHTADRALSVWGRELADLFVGAARGMFQLMDLEAGGQPATEWHEIALEAADAEILLVDWLNELLYVGEVEGLLPVDFQIQSLTETALVARVGCIPVQDPSWEVKAATFHNLELVREADGWSTLLVFDV
jgi:riboflavin kinase / FMN adenylyltransferase